MARPHLDRLIEERLAAHRLLVVAATAGAGKTTAVVQAADRWRVPMAWLTLDWTDASPGRLLTYLESALVRIDGRVRGIAKDALALGVSHEEAAGLLVSSLGEPVLVVIDQLERLELEPEAWAVIGAFARHAGQNTKLVLISRHELPLELCRLPSEATQSSVDDADLAFTVEEIAEVLQRSGDESVDAQQVSRATGGWVTGVLFDAWRSAEHVAGSGGERDPLFGYLSSEIVSRLSEEERQFIESSALLDEVDAERARSLGLPQPAQRLVDLRRAHLPVVWTTRGAMRCHPRFREYLLERLQRRGVDQYRELRRRYGRLLADEGYAEEAVEELLAAAAPEEAITPATTSIMGVIERLDLSVAERWLDALRHVHGAEAPIFSAADLLLAWARDDYARAVGIADNLSTAGRRDEVAASSALAAALMALAYWMGGRRSEIEPLLEVARPGPEIDAARYLEATMVGAPDAVAPTLTGGLFDAAVLMTIFFAGRFADLTPATSSPWLASVSAPWRVGALAGSGRTAEALELYESLPATKVGGLALKTLAPDLLFDAGRFDQAQVALRDAQLAARQAGAVAFGLWLASIEIKFVLRLDRDPATARRLIDRLKLDPWVAEVPHLSALADSFDGFASLIENDNVRALDRLRDSVARISAADALTDLVPAAIWLAEAQWRAGNDEAANRAADLALEAAEHQSSNHLLLQALADFPAVVARRLAAITDTDSAWHILGRALVARGAVIQPVTPPTVRLREFGSLDLSVDGEPVSPGITKAAELLAFLAAQPHRRASRDQLLHALFEARRDDSARAYLRQAVSRLRQVLPDGFLTSDQAYVAVAIEQNLWTESHQFENAMAEAPRLQGEARLAATLTALEPVAAGPYLSVVSSLWAHDRRRLLEELATDGRLDAASLAFGLGYYSQASQLAERVLEDDPLRERAWRLQMRLAGSMGDGDRLLSTYRECQRALATIGVMPAAETRRLLGRLRGAAAETNVPPSRSPGP